jgi:DNA repair protein RecO (recombination protein O)
LNWQDEGFVLSVARFGDTDAILDVLTRDHGRHLGLVKGGASKTRRADLQPGNHVRVGWTARLTEQLGRYEVEPIRAYASLALDSGPALAGLTAAAAVAATCLPERELHPAVCEGFHILMQALTGPQPDIAPIVFVRWEVGLLQDLGFGLDLAKCAVTGTYDDLAFVSPRTGRAVSRTAAAPYAGRLLALPPFLLGTQAGHPTPADIAAGLKLTGHFLLQSVLEPHGKTLPQARDYYADLVTR